MKGDVLTPEQFIAAVRTGRRNFEGAIVRGDLTIEREHFDPPLDFSGLTVEGDLTLKFLTGCTINRIRSSGAVLIQSCQ